MICNKCKTEIDLENIKVEYRGAKRYFFCPGCKIKYELYRTANKRYKSLESGQLVRKYKKVRMSKKERLKKRKELKDKINK